MTLPRNSRRNLAYGAAVIIVGAILVSAALILPARMTSISSTTTAISTPLLAECPTRVTTPWFGTLNAGTTSPITICFQLYEFNSTSPVVLNATKILSIFGYSHTGFLFNGGANFTVAPSVDHISLGGSNSENEGVIIGYSITARAGARGTYLMDLDGWLLNPDEPEECTGGAGQIVVGDGQPNYATPGGCITTTTTGSASGFAIPGVHYTVPSSMLYYRIVGVGNSTA